MTDANSMDRADPIAYLDANAGAPVRPAVAAAMVEALSRVGNPSSVHRAGQEARRALDAARAEVAALAGATPEGVVFTASGTEANALALRGCGRERVLVSAVEHASVLEAVPGAETVPVDGMGRVDLDRLRDLLAADSRPALVSVMASNNETGVIQPLAEVAAIARRFGALLHSDAVAAAGYLPIDMGALGVDLLTLSAHKIGGAPGAATLLVGEGVEIAPMLRGGHQEAGRRAGTPNLPAIVGFGVAARATATDIGNADRIRVLRDRIEAAIAAMAPGCRVMGRGAARVANTVCATMPGVSSETQVIALDLASIAVSAGAACTSGRVRRSHVLLAMGVAPEVAETAIRISLGWHSTAADVARLLDAWTALYRRTRAGAGPRAERAA